MLYKFIYLTWIESLMANFICFGKGLLSFFTFTLPHAKASKSHVCKEEYYKKTPYVIILYIILPIIIEWLQNET